MARKMVKVWGGITGVSFMQYADILWDVVEVRRVPGDTKILLVRNVNPDTQESAAGWIHEKQVAEYIDMPDMSDNVKDIIKSFKESK